MRINKVRLLLEITQAAMWACVFLLPSVIFVLFTHDFGTVVWTFRIMFVLILPAFAAYYLNYYYLVPRLVFERRLPVYILVNLALLGITLFNNYFHSDWINVIPLQLPNEVSSLMIAAGFTGFLAFALLGQVMVTLLAVGMRYIIKWNDERQAIEEERRRNAEAELNWLKNQLNPHFLFNTLNNISSLIQIDPDKAQECIGQLSELLRYALYESNVRKVRIGDEITFMKNYIDLMTLRCSKTTRIESRFDVPDSDIMISSLLFISLIENAFKHGTSAHKESFIKIDMSMDGNDIVFTSENTLFEKKTEDYSCSGIGLENLKRRLELLYPDAYSYNCFTEGNAYITLVRIRNIRNYV
ncbi:MAG: histidine kinase [Bacteroidales bacterium]|nr:histidine kinase [Bacteroidales bacterium]